jgi:hypothetical protein
MDARTTGIVLIVISLAVLAPLWFAFGNLVIPRNEWAKNRPLHGWSLVAVLLWPLALIVFGWQAKHNDR